MQNLLAAIKTYWNVTSGLVTGVGPLGLMEIPPGTAASYVVMYPIASPTTWKYGGAAFSEPLLQFTVRGGTANATLLLAEAMCVLLDDHIFTLTGSKQCFRCQRTGEPIPEPTDPDLDASGQPSFGWVVSYEIANT